MQDRVRGINKVIEVSDNNRNNSKARLASLGIIKCRFLILLI